MTVTNDTTHGCVSAFKARFRELTGVKGVIPDTVWQALRPEYAEGPLCHLTGVHLSKDRHKVFTLHAVISPAARYGQLLTRVAKVDVSVMTQASVCTTLDKLATTYRAGKQIRLQQLVTHGQGIAGWGLILDNPALCAFIESPEAVLVDLFNHGPGQLAAAARALDKQTTAPLVA